MDWSFVAGPVASLAGGLFAQSSAKDAAAQQFQNQKELMAIQHAYNVTDYENRYQRAVWDMRRAGLNPILAATQGIGGNINGVSAGTAAMAQTPNFSDVGNVLNSAFSTKNQREVALKGLELQERTVANEEYKAQTDRLNVENQIATRLGQLDLAKQAQKFDQDLKSAWQDFAMENESRLTELKAQETAASIRHMAAQDANLSIMAQVALRDVSVKEVLAKVAEDNGISHRALEAAQAVCSERQSEFYEKYGHTQEAQEELARAQTALTNYKRSVAGVETVTDVMKGILSVAIAGKIGMDLIPSGSNSIGF